MYFARRTYATRRHTEFNPVRRRQLSPISYTHALESNRLALLYTRAVAETFVLRWGPAAELIIYYTNCSAWRWRAKKIHLRVCLCMLARE
jgi:hypothetical protein